MTPGRVNSHVVGDKAHDDDQIGPPARRYHLRRTGALGGGSQREAHRCHSKGPLATPSRALQCEASLCAKKYQESHLDYPKVPPGRGRVHAVPSPVRELLAPPRLPRLDVAGLIHGAAPVSAPAGQREPDEVRPRGRLGRPGLPSTPTPKPLPRSPRRRDRASKLVRAAWSRRRGYRKRQRAVRTRRGKETPEAPPDAGHVGEGEKTDDSSATLEPARHLSLPLPGGAPRRPEGSPRNRARSGGPGPLLAGPTPTPPCKCVRGTPRSRGRRASGPLPPRNPRPPQPGITPSRRPRRSREARPSRRAGG